MCRAPRLLMLACPVACLALGTVAAAQTPGEGVADQPSDTSPSDIQQSAPSFLVHVDVDRSSRAYCEGEAIKVRLMSEDDAYVYVLYQQADGQVYQIFPNSAQPENHVRAKSQIEIPADYHDRFEWVVGPPFGKEVIKVIASKEPRNVLEDPALRQQCFNPVPRPALKLLAAELHKEQTIPWAEDAVEITTRPRDASLDLAGGNRYGVFFGVAQYKHHATAEQATGRGLNLP